MILGGALSGVGDNCPQDNWQAWCACAFPGDPATIAKCSATFGAGGMDFGLFEPPWTNAGARARNIPTSAPFDAASAGLIALDPLNLFGSKAAAPGQQPYGQTPPQQVPFTQQQVGGIPMTYVLAAGAGVLLVLFAALAR